MAIAMVNTQMIPFLTKAGYSLTQRGYILAATAIVSILFHFIFGYICDKFKKIRIFFILAYTILIISSYLMFTKETDMFYYHLFTVSFMAGFVRVITGLNETWMLAIDKENYGKSRAAGALGLTIGSPIAGWIIGKSGYMLLLVIFSIISVILFYFIFKTKDAQETKKTITLNEIKQLCFNKLYIFLVVIYLLILMIGTADQYVVIDKMLDLNGGNTWVGIKWAVQAFMEVPLFLFAGKLLKKYSIISLLKFSVFMYGIKFALYAFVQTPLLLTIVSSLQLVTLPLVMLTSKLAVTQVTSKDVSNSAQMFAMAVFMGGSALITPLITAPLANVFGYDITLYIIAGFAIVPFIGIYVYDKVLQRNKN